MHFSDFIWNYVISRQESAIYGWRALIYEELFIATHKNKKHIRPKSYALTAEQFTWKLSLKKLHVKCADVLKEIPPWIFVHNVLVHSN